MATAKRLALESIFALKGNFAQGLEPERKVFDGVEVAPFKGGASAAVTISADTEMNWAFRGRSAEVRDSLGATERHNIPVILDILSDYSIPITWATVGHLFLSACDRHDGTPHQAMPRPPANERWSGDWYKHDPCTDVERDPLWYAPDLMALIASSKVPHEIGSHTFSHIDFSAHTSDERLVTKEIEACRAAMKPFGLDVKSLVYPFNNMGHRYLGLLSGLGIIAVRHRDDRVRLSYPERSEPGVYKLYESMNLRKADWYDYPEKAAIFLARASERRAAYHLWFHPSDPTDLFQREFRRILEVVQRFRDDGHIWVATMRALASYCEARHRTNVRVSRRGAAIELSVECDLDTSKYDATEITLNIPAPSRPRTILRRRSGVASEIPASACSYREGRLLLDVESAPQTLELSW